jgi:DNA-binding transcriptional ArsR family regulator
MSRTPTSRPRPPRLATLASARAAEALVHRAFDERFVGAQYAWTSMLLEYLIATRHRMGDLDRALILGVIGLSVLSQAQRNFRNATADKEPDYAGKLLPDGAEINAYSLSNITGIPRETVRRKLSSLEKAGLIEQLPNGAWTLTADDQGGAHARAELQELVNLATQGLARLYGQLVKLDQSIRETEPGKG